MSSIKKPVGSNKGIHRANKGGKKNEKLGNAMHTEDVTDKVGNAPKPVNKTHKVSDSKPNPSKLYTPVEADASTGKRKREAADPFDPKLSKEALKQRVDAFMAICKKIKKSGLSAKKPEKKPLTGADLLLEHVNNHRKQ